MAGTSQDLKLAQWVRDQFLSFGFLEENVELKEYEVLLQYPVSRSLRLLSGGDIEGVKYPYSPTLEEPQLEGDNIPTDVVKDAIMSYNAYSKPGNVTAPLIYVNHGTEDDYLLLQNAGYNLTGRVAIAVRYSYIFLSFFFFFFTSPKCIVLFFYFFIYYTPSYLFVPKPNDCFPHCCCFLILY